MRGFRRRPLTGRIYDAVPGARVACWQPRRHFDCQPLSVSWCGGHRRFEKRQFNMVVIRLARGGAKGRPFYNIVVADARERRDGRYLERVGFYNPMAAGAEQPLRVALDRVTYWSGVGARLSPTVARLVDQARKAA